MEDEISKMTSFEKKQFVLVYQEYFHDLEN